MQRSLENIIEYGQEFNREWLAKNSTHWLAKTYEILHNKSIIFLSTSCEITAEMIRWKLSKFMDNWELLNADDIKFEEVHKKYRVFQISIGEDCYNNEHVVTIFEEFIVQSYYGSYTIEKNILTPNIIRAINEGSKKDSVLTSKSYKTITRSLRCPQGLMFKGDQKLRIHYWVPTTGSIL